MTRWVLAIFSFLTSAFGFWNPSILAAQELNIAVFDNLSGVDLYRDKRPLDYLLRRALSTSIVERDDSVKGWRVTGIAKIRILAQEKTIVLILDSDARYYGGKPISLIDLKYSLKRCEKHLGSDFVFNLLDNGRDDPSGRELRLFYGETDADYALATLSECPIFEQRSSTIFGAELLKGTNLVSSGAYYILSFKPEKRIELALRPEYLEHKALAARNIHITKYQDPRHALASLRRTYIDLFFTNNQEVIALAKKDETLLASKCSIYSVVYRKDFRMRCKPDLELTELGYVK